LFWKKKKPETDIIEYESDSLRESYRYQFKDNQGFQITFKDKKVLIVNIGAGGIAFYNNGFKESDSDVVSFTLNIPNFTGDSNFCAKLKIITIDDNNICHSVFENCSPAQSELIHKYVLEMQKDDLAH